MYGIDFVTNENQINEVLSTIIVETKISDTPGKNINDIKLMHQCANCDAYFMDKDILKRHIGLIHERKIPIECTYCYAVFIEERKLIQHKVCHSIDYTKYTYVT